MYEWTSEWEQSAGGPSRSDNIRVNNGFSGIELACDKNNLGFTIDLVNDKILAASSDSSNKMFVSIWLNENTPSTNVDDITTSAEIPEFNTLAIPMASVMLIVGNRMRKKNE